MVGVSVPFWVAESWQGTAVPLVTGNGASIDNKILLNFGFNNMCAKSVPSGKKTKQIASRWRIRPVPAASTPLQAPRIRHWPHEELSSVPASPFPPQALSKTTTKNLHPDIVVHTCTCLLPPLGERRRVARTSRLAWAT